MDDDRTSAPDRYGSTVLPRISLDVTLNGGEHPVEISGRYLRCQIHQNQLTSSMVIMTQGEPECVTLSRQWHDYFVNPFGRRHSVLFPLKEEAEQVTLAMIHEITQTTNLSATQARDALLRVPQMQADPTFLDDIPAWAWVLEWASHKHARDDSLLPYVKMHAPLAIDLELSPQDLRTSLRRQLDVRLHPTHQPIKQFQPPLSSTKDPLNIQTLAVALPSDSASPILSHNHVVNLDQDGNFTCLLHQRDRQCNLEMDILNNCSPGRLPLILSQLGERTLSERVLDTTSAGGLPSALLLNWRHHRKAWVRADMIYKFIDHFVMNSEVAAFIAYGIAPEEADRWSLVGCHEAKQVVFCQALSRYQSARSDGHIALVVSAWEDSDLELVLSALVKCPDWACGILAYQEAGWSPVKIAMLLREKMVYPDASGLHLPPPELKAEREVMVGSIPLGEFDEIMNGDKSLVATSQ